MARTATRTFTITKTFTRLELIINQFREMLRQTTDISLLDLERLEGGLEEKHRWIEQISVYALDKNALCYAELSLKINWKEYDRQKSFSLTIDIDNRWMNDISIELDEAIILFNKCIASSDYKVEIYVYLTAEVNADKSLYASVATTLGIVKTKPVVWAGKKEGRTRKLLAIPECETSSYFFFK